MTIITQEGAPPVRRVAWALCLFFLSLYVLTTDGHFFSTDEIQLYQVARSVLARTDPSIEPLRRAVSGSCGGIGAALIAAPFSRAGLWLQKHLPEPWRGALAGDRLGEQGEWGGDAVIFTTDLVNLAIAAVLCTVFFLFAHRLGFSRRVALLLALVLGLSTAIGAHAKHFFEQNLVALCLLAAAHLLHAARERGGLAAIAFAGLFLGWSVVTSALEIAWVPFFVAYLLWPARRDRPPAAGRAMIGRAVCLLAPVGAALLARAAIGRLELGSRFAGPGFDGSLLVGLYGNLLSPGRSIFLYSPPLLLALFAWPRFARRFPAETFLILGVALAHLLVYSCSSPWDGGWGWGNRHLLPAVPFLLPLGVLVERALGGDRRLQAALVACAALGALVQVLGVFPYISSVYWDWLRSDLNPPDAYLWVPEISPLAAHCRALVAGRYGDLWLHFVATRYGPGVLLTFAFPLLCGLAFALHALWGVWTLASGSDRPSRGNDR